MLERQVSGAHTWRCPWQAAVCMAATRQCLFSLQKKKSLFNLAFLESISRQAQVKLSLC